MTNFRDQLKVEGINARGYGILPKMVMLDRKLTIESKAIYSYFCSYAGAGNQAFPGTKKIREDLCISKDRYYKHFNLLKSLGYIKVEQVRNDKGTFKHNLYTLVTNPEPIEEDFKPVDNLCENSQKLEPTPSPANKDSDKDQLNTASQPCPENPDTENPDTENKDTIINTLYKNNNSLYNQSFNQTKNERLIENTNKNLEELEKILDKAEVKKIYLEGHYYPVKRAIESLYYRNINLNINGMSIPPSKIRRDLLELNSFHIEMGIQIFKEQSRQQKITNRINYLATCIYTSIFDMELKIQNDLIYDGII